MSAHAYVYARIFSLSLSATYFLKLWIVMWKCFARLEQKKKTETNSLALYQCLQNSF